MKPFPISFLVEVAVEVVVFSSEQCETVFEELKCKKTCFSNS
jgi:hypothetical protein